MRVTTHHPAATQAVATLSGHRQRLTAAAACAGAALVVTALVVLAWAPLQRLDDRVVADAVAWTLDRPFLHRPLALVGVVSGKWILWIFCIVMTVALYFARRWHEALFLISTIAVTTIVTGGVKHFVQRDRPRWYVPEDNLPTTSFPSGHVSLWVAFAGVVVLALPALVRLTPTARRVLHGGFAVVIAVISLQRVLQGRHFPTDLVAGALIGAGCVLGCWVLTDLALAAWFEWLHPVPPPDDETA